MFVLQKHKHFGRHSWKKNGIQQQKIDGLGWIEQEKVSTFTSGMEDREYISQVEKNSVTMLPEKD